MSATVRSPNGLAAIPGSSTVTFSGAVLLVDLEGNGRADGHMFGLLELVGHARPGTLRLALPTGPAATNVNHSRGRG
jgi:hypothetical protein